MLSAVQAGQGGQGVDSRDDQGKNRPTGKVKRRYAPVSASPDPGICRKSGGFAQIRAPEHLARENLKLFRGRGCPQPIAAGTTVDAPARSRGAATSATAPSLSSCTCSSGKSPQRRAALGVRLKQEDGEKVGVEGVGPGEKKVGDGRGTAKRGLPLVEGTPARSGPIRSETRPLRVG